MWKIFSIFFLTSIHCGCRTLIQKRNVFQASEDYPLLRRTLNTSKLNSKVSKLTNCENIEKWIFNSKRLTSFTKKGMNNRYQEVTKSSLKRKIYEIFHDFYLKIHLGENNKKRITREAIFPDPSDSEQLEIQLKPQDFDEKSYKILNYNISIDESVVRDSSTDNNTLITDNSTLITENITVISTEIIISNITDNFTSSSTNSITVLTFMPICKVADGNCTSCRDVSPYCHYMYSEERCVYYDSIHSSNIYECGERWFPKDKNEAFFATLTILIAVSSSIAGYLIWKRYHQVIEDELPTVEEENMEEMRAIIREIRHRRLGEPLTGPIKSEPDT